MFKYNDLYIFFLSLNCSLSSLKAMIYIQITFDIKSPSNHKCNFPNAQVIAPCLALIPYKLQPSLKKKKKTKNQNGAYNFGTLKDYTSTSHNGWKWNSSHLAILINQIK